MTAPTSHHERFVYIVGDRFEGFAQNSDVLCFSAARTQLAGWLQDPREPVTIVLGQGLQPEQAFQICADVDRARAPVDLVRLTEASHPAGRALCHKHQPHNTLITEPYGIGAQRYQAMLRADDRCADMADHQTGQHIQGMVLVEAARQMLLAVTEKYLMTAEQQGTMDFTLNALDVQLLRFTFPLEVDLVFEVLERHDDPRGSASFRARATFRQADQVTAEIGLRYGIFDRKQLQSIEAKKARQCLEASRARLIDDAQAMRASS